MKCYIISVIAASGRTSDMCIVIDCMAQCSTFLSFSVVPVMGTVGALSFVTDGELTDQPCADDAFLFDMSMR